MVYHILVSSNTESIYTLGFEPASGSLDLVCETHTGYHPSWITSYSHDKSLIFAGLEHEEGKIVALKFLNGKGVVAKTITSGGSDPCSLLVTNDELFVANYSGGSVALFPISPDPPYLLTSSPDTISMSGSGPHKRQSMSHPHQVVLIEEYQELLVPDLGADKVWRLKRGEADVSWRQQAYVQYEPGSGPRHTVYHGGYLYTLCELGNRVVKHRLSPLPAEPEYITSTSTMSSPPPPPFVDDMFAAEILLPKPNAAFPAPYLYVSNRNDPSPDGDTIAIYSVAESEELQLVNEVRTGLKHVRGMEFGGPDDKWLVVGGLYGGGVKMFERVGGGKELRIVAVNGEVNAPAGFLWV